MSLVQGALPGRAHAPHLTHIMRPTVINMILIQSPNASEMANDERSGLQNAFNMSQEHLILTPLVWGGDIYPALSALWHFAHRSKQGCLCLPAGEHSCTPVKPFCMPHIQALQGRTRCCPLAGAPQASFPETDNWHPDFLSKARIHNTRGALRA